MSAAQLLKFSQQPRYKLFLRELNLTSADVDRLEAILDLLNWQTEIGGLLLNSGDAQLPGLRQLSVRLRSASPPGLTWKAASPPQLPRSETRVSPRRGDVRLRSSEPIPRYLIDEVEEEGLGGSAHHDLMPPIENLSFGETDIFDGIPEAPPASPPPVPTEYLLDASLKSTPLHQVRSFSQSRRPGLTMVYQQSKPCYRTAPL